MNYLSSSFALVLTVLCIGCGMFRLGAEGAFAPDPVIDARIESALQVARARMLDTVAQLQATNSAETDPAKVPYYPSYTENRSINPTSLTPDGLWVVERANGAFWTKGSFAGLLWLMARAETNSVQRLQWQAWARAWSEPLRFYSDGDVMMNNYLAFEEWLQQSTTEVERDTQRQTLMAGARLLAMPYDRATDTGRFHLDIGAMGYRRKADTTKVEWFHAFMDHSVNVNQLLTASWLADDPQEALDWRVRAMRHIRTLNAAMGEGRNPGNSGSWQRGYFDWNTNSTNYGKFLFNETKQGWNNASTWSRGQAWWVLATSLAYQHTHHPDMLVAARAAASYYEQHLPDRYPGAARQPGVFVPPWDFDYAAQVNSTTEYDSSAAAMALAGIVRLVAALPPNDPDRARYLEVVHGTLLNLTAAPFLNTNGLPQMSILLKGCYHHFACPNPSKVYNNGLIWGDYFFVDALLTYRALRDWEIPSVPNPGLRAAVAPQGMEVHWSGAPGMIYQLETSTNLLRWDDVGMPVFGLTAPADVSVPSMPDGYTRFWRLRLWPKSPATP
jgi:unsaturated chondroitin disaccharide hydrolase